MPKDPFDLGRRALNTALKADVEAEAALRRLEDRDAARARRGRRSEDDLAEHYPTLRSR